MNLRDNLLTAPQTPDFLIEPDNPKSVKVMEDTLLKRALWEEVDDVWSAKGGPCDKGISKEQFVASLSSDEVQTFIDRAQIRALTTSSKVKGLAGRVSMSIAYKVLRKNTYRTIGEKYNNIREFLEDKLDPDDPHGSSSYEAAFLLELIQSFETMGKGDFADKIFGNKFVYGKLVAAIPSLRKKQNALVAAKTMFDDLVGDIEKEKKSLRKQKSDARIKGAPESELKKFDEQIQVLDERKEKVVAEHTEKNKKLQADLTATTVAAVQLAGSPIPRAEIVQSIPKAAKIHLEKQGFKPEDVSPEYGEEEQAKAKPEAYAVHLDRKVFYVIEANARQSALISKLLSDSFDLKLAELEEAIEFLSKNRKKGA